MLLNTRSYEEVHKDVEANLARYQIPASAIAMFQELCRHEGHLEQAVKEDGEVVIMCDLCGMDTFL